MGNQHGSNVKNANRSFVGSVEQHYATFALLKGIANAAIAITTVKIVGSQNGDRNNKSTLGWYII